MHMFDDLVDAKFVFLLCFVIVMRSIWCSVWLLGGFLLAQLPLKSLLYSDL